MQQAFESILESYVKGKRVVILGFGREGQSTYHTIRSLVPECEITIADKHQLSVEIQQDISKDTHVKLQTGTAYLEAIKTADTVFVTPGIPVTSQVLKDAEQTGTIITTQTAIFFEAFHDQLIAVTGTKGKSTASSVIHQVLQFCDIPVRFVGNIGTPAFDVASDIKDEYIVYETSSHQSNSVRVGPHWGVFLNVYQEHLDYYGTMESYIEAKEHMFLVQQPDDVCIYNADDEVIVKRLSAYPARKLVYAKKEINDADVFVEDESIVIRTDGKKESLIQTAHIPLLGEHNLYNVMPAVLIAQELQCSTEKIAAALKHVTPVEKRLEKVAAKHDIAFWDDALATIPEATSAALQALGKTVTTLIVGGQDRGQHFEALANQVATSQVRTLITFPTTGASIASLVQAKNPTITIVPATSMRDAVHAAMRHTKAGESVLLSTASPSFGMFRDYRDRSEQYLAAIEELK